MPRPVRMVSAPCGADAVRTFFSAQIFERSAERKWKNLKILFDKACILMYNNQCVTNEGRAQLHNW